MAGEEGLRRRRDPTMADVSDTNTRGNENDSRATSAPPPKLSTETFWLTRIVLLRYLGFIYFVAFLVALHQNKQLIGKNGLLPADKYLEDIKHRTGGINMQSWSYVPSLLWLVDYKSSIDTYLDYIALAGMALSGLVIVVGGASCIVMAALWMLYHSIVNVGQRWYSFGIHGIGGWESQLLETGFLAIFLCPVLSVNPVPKGTPVSRVVIWAYRWLIFRIMLGAGLIKIRGDKCWRDLTCMNYHYETQPVPNPLSYYLHQTPEIFHKFETLTNHFVELVAPFLLVLPRRFMIAGGIIQILFQVVLIMSGNLSFLNWLTILPSLACFDDVSISWMFSTKRGTAYWRVAEILVANKHGKAPPLTLGNHVRRVYNVGLGCALVYLSLPVVQNLLSSKQAMNTSFDSLRIVNTYGAFGSITKERTEVIFEGTYSSDPYCPKAVWQEYQFKCKPGNTTRAPCLISPYHYRLDWLMWFAAFQNFQYNPWLVHLAVKLLANEDTAISLIDYNPFEGKPPPKFIRAEHYQYRYTRIGSKAATKGQWWRRKHIGSYLPPISLESARPVVNRMGWKLPEIQDS